MWRQSASQVLGLPTSWSRVHGSPSLGQMVGQLSAGSQVSPAPRRLSPQIGAQSASVAAEQPAGQQPSPVTQAVMSRWVQVRVQPSTDPETTSTVQALASSQDRGHESGAPAVIPRSQVSPESRTPLPHTTGQSLSVTAEQPAGQQPSWLRQAVIRVVMHSAVHVPTEPR